MTFDETKKNEIVAARIYCFCRDNEVNDLHHNTQYTKKTLDIELPYQVTVAFSVSLQDGHERSRAQAAAPKGRVNDWSLVVHSGSIYGGVRMVNLLQTVILWHAYVNEDLRKDDNAHLEMTEIPDSIVGSFRGYMPRER
ncbi:hypothetical protein BDN70DRAFT_172046 [Pholiota conissans]|uniref:Uncharacterized protein n=1 Tax=Pholiota conissans TaxID=109636 RepID=A0A9P6CQZ3_9AGAR|nr:hypothetical protein BDN70DRAFT_172046 [Pholiota conissans]